MDSFARPWTRLPLSAALAVLAAMQAGCPVWQEQETPVQELRRIEPVTRGSYYLYVPSDYSFERAWPLVVTLHGTHGFDSAKAQVREWKALAEKNGFLVLAPALNSPQGILPVRRSARLRALEKDEKRILSAIEDVKRAYCIDERAVMITGFSAGGYPLYFTALRHPELFNSLVARACNCDLEIVRSIPVSEELRKLPVLIFFSKTGINPLSSNLNPIAKQSWAAFRHLRESRCFKAEIDAVSGGHHRRPEVAYRFWKKHLPKRR